MLLVSGDDAPDPEIDHLYGVLAPRSTGDLVAEAEGVLVHEERAHGDGSALGCWHCPDFIGAGERVGVGKRGLADAHGPVPTLLNHSVAQVGARVMPCVEGDVLEMPSFHLGFVDQSAGRLIVAVDVADHALFSRTPGLLHRVLEEVSEKETGPVEPGGCGGALHVDALLGELDAVLLIVVAKVGHDADHDAGHEDRQDEDGDEGAEAHECSR